MADRANHPCITGRHHASANQANAFVSVESALATIDNAVVGALVGDYFRREGQIKTIMQGDVELYLHTGFRPANWDDVDENEDYVFDVETITFADCLIWRGKMIDAMLWISLPRGQKRDKVMWVTDDTLLGPVTDKPMSEAFFIQLFLIITRGQPSTAATKEPGKDIPRYLINVFGDDWTPREMAATLTNKAINKVPLEFMMHVNLNNCPEQVRNRLLKTNVGKRPAVPFSIFKYATYVNATTAGAAQVAEVLIRRGPCWDTHPATMSDRWRTYASPLVANLNNLLLTVFPLGVLQMFLAESLIARLPTYTSGQDAQKWRDWRVGNMPRVDNWFFAAADRDDILPERVLADAAFTPAQAAANPEKREIGPLVNAVLPPNLLPQMVAPQ